MLLLISRLFLLKFRNHFLVNFSLKSLLPSSGKSLQKGKGMVPDVQLSTMGLEQANVAQLEARRLVVSEIRDQTLSGAK